MAIELAEFIERLRAELVLAMHSGEESELRFELGPVELEMTVGVDREAKPGAKVRFWVVELGAEGKLADKSTQRIKLTLDPRRPGEPDRKPWISGAEVDGER